MNLSVPKSVEDFKNDGPSFEMELLPGWCVCSGGIPDIAPQGVLVAWDNLDSDQQEAFQAVHNELTTAAAKLKELFKQLGDRVEDF